MGLQEREDTQIWVMPLLAPKIGFPYGTLLEAIGIVLETHFGFGFHDGSPVGDSLRN